MSLGGSFVRGSVYLGGSQLVVNAANFAMQIPIARFLGPAEYGLYALCFAIDQVLNVVGAFSISFALIQSDEEVGQREYDTALVLCALQGAAGLALAALAAPVLGAQRSADAGWMLVALAFARVFRLLAQVPQAELERSLRYGAVSGINTVVGTAPNVVAVVLAWRGLGAWSLVGRDVLVTLLLAAASFSVSSYRFRGAWSTEARARLMDFARPMFWSRAIEIALEQLDRAAVALAFGNQPAGYYHAGRFVAEAGFVATRPVERLSLNLYARVQRDPARLARAWSLTNYFLLRTMLAGAAALLVFPDVIARLLYGDGWDDVGDVLRWLALYAGLFPVFHNAKNLLYGTGAVREMVRVRYVQLAVFVASVGAAAWVGSVAAMAAALLATTCASLALAWQRASRRVAPPPRADLVTPFAVLAVVAPGLRTASAAGALDALPPLALPLLPPVAFAALVLAIEGRRPLRELAYLRAQARAR
ncbi:MAG: oligosaccharide flippase family protein [Myxococcota bacterium]